MAGNSSILFLDFPFKTKPRATFGDFQASHVWLDAITSIEASQ